MIWLSRFVAAAVAKNIWIMGVGLPLEQDRELFHDMFQKAALEAKADETHWVEALDGPKLWSIFQSIEREEGSDRRFFLFLLSHGGWSGESVNPGRGDGRLQGASGDNLALLLGYLPKKLNFLALVACFSTSIFKSVHSSTLPQGLKLVTFEDAIPPVLALEYSFKEASLLFPFSIPESQVIAHATRLRFHIPMAMKLRLEAAGRVLAWIKTDGPATLSLEGGSEPFCFISQISEPIGLLAIEVLGDRGTYVLVKNASGLPLGSTRWVYSYVPH